MNVEEFYNQEMNGKPAVQSCFANTVGITYSSGVIDQEVIHAEDEMKAFAEAYSKKKLNDFYDWYLGENPKTKKVKKEVIDEFLCFNNKH